MAPACGLPAHQLNTIVFIDNDFMSMTGENGYRIVNQVSESTSNPDSSQSPENHNRK
jgi:hypothetical protein